eukprot:2374386-Rhodomonas_salina.2
MAAHPPQNITASMIWCMQTPKESGETPLEKTKSVRGTARQTFGTENGNDSGEREDQNKMERRSERGLTEEENVERK